MRAAAQPDSTAAADVATVAADRAAAVGLEFNAAGAACVSPNAQANVNHATHTVTNGVFTSVSACEMNESELVSRVGLVADFGSDGSAFAVKNYNKRPFRFPSIYCVRLYPNLYDIVSKAPGGIYELRFPFYLFGTRNIYLYGSVKLSSILTTGKLRKKKQKFVTYIIIPLIEYVNSLTGCRPILSFIFRNCSAIIPVYTFVSILSKRNPHKRPFDPTTQCSHLV